ncbi:ribosome maturation factor RimM [Aquirufa aurantiipilula]|uniref:Ribosome maturation factor RimM n=1 Tax=Aquirufa aurantiipilula TaxID=2696561 RepID=A0ABT6BHB2_9BACT|nr:ribosome maturation factor RimM [Aquirufa aurantiipilula]MBZ1325381.1 16S rRNA processing protein RimM [Aquirufa aurantiipilula]MDF5689829.1 ribosome maturation factor RimM [Aquirufa aurantiipilula]
MAATEYFELGTLSKPHGIKGAFHVYLDVDDPEEYEDLDAVFLQLGNEMVPYFITDLQIRSNLNLMSLEGIETVDAAKELVGVKLFLPVSMLPKLKDNQFYYHEIVGYQVVDKNHGTLGTVKEVYSTGAQDVLVMTYQSKEVLIPLMDEIIPKVDKKNKLIHSILPDGLLEVYLDDAN